MKIFKIGVSVLFISTIFCVSSFGWQEWSNRGIGNTISGTIRDIKVIANSDGRLELFAIQRHANTYDVTLWHKWERQPNTNQWSSWKSMGAPEGSAIVFDQQIAAERNSYGEIEVFVRCLDGNIYYRRQYRVGGWSSWKILENANEPLSPKKVSNIGVYTGDRGAMAVTVIDIYGAYWVKLRSSPYRQWSNWSSKGRPSATELTKKKPMIGLTTSDGKSFLPQYYALGEDGYMWNWAYYNPSSDRWESMGRPYYGISDRMDPIIAYNEDRRLEIFVLGNDDQFWKTYQIPGTYEWSRWVRLAGRTDKGRDKLLDRDIFLDVWDTDVVQNKDGRIELFYVNSHGNIYHTWQRIPNGYWVGRWEYMGHPPNQPADSVAACPQLDGTLFIFTDVKPDSFSDNYLWYRHW